MHEVLKVLSKYHRKFSGAVVKLLHNFDKPTSIYKNLL